GYGTDRGGRPQPDDLKAVMEGAASVEPKELLQACLSVENEMGRVRAERWGPRLIDLDVLTFGDQVIDEPGLTVPHPRMIERAFVLVPLLELLAEATLPGGRSIDTLRLEAAGSGQVRLFAPAMSMP